MYSENYCTRLTTILSLSLSFSLIHIHNHSHAFSPSHPPSHTLITYSPSFSPSLSLPLSPSLYIFLILKKCILKIIAPGFYNKQHKKAYLRNKWNVLDFFIVIVSVIDIALPNTDIVFLKCIRVLRGIKNYLKFFFYYY